MKVKESHPYRVCLHLKSLALQATKSFSLRILYLFQLLCTQVGVASGCAFHYDYPSYNSNFRTSAAKPAGPIFLFVESFLLRIYNGFVLETQYNFMLYETNSLSGSNRFKLNLI